MASHFSSIGFSITNQQEFEDLAIRSANAGRTIPSGEGFYILHAPGAGVELWGQATPKREVCGCHPHFAGTSRVRMGVMAFVPDPEHALDGAAYGWAEPAEGNPEDGAYPLLVDIPDFQLAAATLQPPQIVTLQVAAFAYELSCFPDDDAYAASQEHESGFAPESFIPSGLINPDGSEPEAPKAQAIFTGHVLASERRTNPETGQDFYWLSVQTYGGIYDVVADPLVVEGSPTVGGVVQGAFWLSGRVVDGG